MISRVSLRIRQAGIVPEIDFQKFTSYGNNFIIVDETQGPQLKEDEKSRFACQATNVNYGIGADGVLFLQPYRSDILAEINAIRHYWEQFPVYHHLDIMFRIFEPNGVESFSCGNGLMCMAHAHTVAGLPNAGAVPAAAGRVQNVVELCEIQGPLQWGMLAEKPVIEDGWLYLPDRPGFGVTLAENVAEKYPHIEGHYGVIVERD